MKRSPRAARPRRRSWRSESGKGLVWLAFALPALLGLVGLTLDTGRLYLGRQRAVNVVDAATLAAGRHLGGTGTNTTALKQDVLDTVASNNKNADASWHVDVSNAALSANPDIIVAGFNDTPATNTTLTAPIIWTRDDGSPCYASNPPTYAPSQGYGVIVRGHTSVSATFMSLLGFGDTAIGGSATIMTDCAGTLFGTEHILPIWLTGPFSPGDSLSLSANNGSPPLPPGSYGWLSPQSFPPYTYSNSDFNEWVQYGAPGDVSLSIYSGGPTQVGTPGIVSAYTGWSWGQIVHAIERDPGNKNPAVTGARFERAAALYPSEQPNGSCGTAPGPAADPLISAGNPRIVVVPLVEYVSGSGANAVFKVTGFGAFYIRCLGNANTKTITAQFINYVTAGEGGGLCLGVRVKEFVR